MKKRGFFYVVDAFVAVSILIVTLLLLYNTSLNKPAETQTSTLSFDFMELLSKTLIAESSSDYIKELREEGVIKHTRLTLLEQAVAFYDLDNNLAIEFLNGTFQDIIPYQYSGVIEIDGDVVYSQINKPEEQADILIPAKRIVFGVDDPNNIYVYTVLIKVWE